MQQPLLQRNTTEDTVPPNIDEPVLQHSASCSASPPGRKTVSVAGVGVESLPDLTPLLKEHGLHEEYVQFREGYMRWRKGEASGAKGELDHAIKRSQDFGYWYPTVGAFNFRRTISFWGGTLTIEGCCLFLWVWFFGEYGKDYTDLMYYMTKWPTLCGGTAFLAGIYMAYYELINMTVDLDADSRNILWCDWQGLLKIGIEVWSIFGASLYLVGALLYTMAQVSDLFVLTEKQNINMVQWPLNIGGFLFVLAGVCELLINRVYMRLPNTFVWWASVFDFFGGIGFWLSACPSLLDDDNAALVGAVGVVAYFFGAVAALFMWRGEQFGSAIIPALNNATRESCPNICVKKDLKTGICHIIATPGNLNKNGDSKLEEVLSPRISIRGMIFLTVYILIGVIQMVVCCAYLSLASDIWAGGIRSRKVMSNFVSDVCNVIMVHMILMLQSACVTLPKKTDQPYHGLFIGIRLLSVILVANSILSLEVIFEADVKGAR